MPSAADVIIAGGGPAGWAAALLLARWGHAVRLVTPPSDGQPSLAVSLPPSAVKLWRLLGVDQAIDGAGFLAGGGNTGGGRARGAGWRPSAMARPAGKRPRRQLPACWRPRRWRPV
jgi:hypothetical protein